jgi:hypothetical protein
LPDGVSQSAPGRVEAAAGGHHPPPPIARAWRLAAGDLVVVCPLCGGLHRHGAPGGQHRAAHCLDSPIEGYLIKIHGRASADLEAEMARPPRRRRLPAELEAA